MTLFSITSVDANYQTLRQATAQSAKDALATYRLFLSDSDVGQVSMSIAVLHHHWSAYSVAGHIALLQYGYNGNGEIAHWKQIKKCHTPAFEQRWKPRWSR